MATEVYKWVDENGVTHYSDQPHPNAKKLDVQSAQTFESRMPAAPASTSAQSPSAQGPTYSSCEINRPENDEVFMNTFTVPASIRVIPALRPGHRVVLSLDGKPLTDQPANATTFVLNEVERGTHTLAAAIQDASGNAICRASSVTFHVRQPSRLAPNPANRPRF
ncbi:MAG: DUF4124 domain-containing protein [Steroidobacteraceae bacterium]|nr:DUF4124 domain-containing protein [Steroidobacteraceae bacterium]